MENYVYGAESDRYIREVGLILSLEEQYKSNIFKYVLQDS